MPSAAAAVGTGRKLASLYNGHSNIHSQTMGGRTQEGSKSPGRGRMMPSEDANESAGLWRIGGMCHVSLDWKIRTGCVM